MNANATLSRYAQARPGPFDEGELRRILEPHAAEDDRTDAAPVEAMQYLVACGAAAAVLPPALGGAGFGWTPSGSAGLSRLLRTLGSAHLSLARLYEGHVNAFQLVWHYGNATQRDSLCRYVANGGWLGVWNAPHAEGPLQLTGATADDFVLDGKKAYASGAGVIDRPLVTAQHAARGYVMVWPRAKYQTGPRDAWEMHGMRASVTLPVHYRHAAVAADDIVGGANDYHREPLFTTGAWRFLAAQVGAGERLMEEMMRALVTAGRDDDPHQRARLAEACMAIQAALLWLDRARAAADAPDDIDGACHVVRMARLAIEQHMLALVELVQRSIGLAAFRRGTPLERIARDLHTYLRQPVPDLVRDQIAGHAIEQHRGDESAR